MTPFLQKLLKINWLLVVAMFGILIFGIFAIESAARHLPVDGEIGEGGSWFARRQQVWILLGTFVYLGTALIDYRLFKFAGAPMYVVGIVLMIAALNYGNEVHQLSFAGVLFQPAQFMVVAGIILLAFMLQDLPRWHQVFKIPLVQVAVIILLTVIPFILVAMAGDMGSALMWVPVTAVVMLVGGVPYRYLTFFLLIAAAALPPAYYVIMPKVSERGADRIELFIDSKQGRELDIQGDAYAQYYVTLSVAKAGYKGIGHNAGEEKGSLHAGKWIPWKTAHNDFIFAVFAEEQGFRGTMLLVTAFGILVIQCIYVSYYSRDMSGQVIACGVAALLAAHVFQNIGMCVELLPITGIPLPLVSYSGTFVLVCMFMLGLVQSVWIHRNVEKPQLAEEPVKLSVRE